MNIDKESELPAGITLAVRRGVGQHDIHSAEGRREIGLARDNFFALFSQLPEEYQTILKTRGLRVVLSEECQMMPTQKHEFASQMKAPAKIHLHFRTFASFHHEKDGEMKNEVQRGAAFILHEEANHAVFEPFFMLREAGKAVRKDMAASDKLRDKDFSALRRYSFFDDMSPIEGEPNVLLAKEFIKQSIQGYVDEHGFNSPIITGEVTTEIAAIRAMIKKLVMQTDEKSFNKPHFRDLGQKYRETLGLSVGANEEQVNSSIDGYMQERFPHTYPLQQTYEKGIKALAKDMEETPALFTRSHGRSFMDWVTRSNPDPWTKHFSGLDTRESVLY